MLFQDLKLVDDFSDVFAFLLRVCPSSEGIESIVVGPPLFFPFAIFYGTVVEELRHRPDPGAFLPSPDPINVAKGTGLRQAAPALLHLLIFFVLSRNRLVGYGLRWG